MNYKCTECENPVRVMASAPFRLVILLLLGISTSYPSLRKVDIFILHFTSVVIV